MPEPPPKLAKIKRTRPEYRLPLFVPFCPVHLVRMYSNKPQTGFTWFRCQHPECKITLKVQRVLHVPVTALPSELRKQFEREAIS